MFRVPGVCAESLVHAAPSQEQGWLGGTSRLRFRLLGSCSSLLSLLSPASLCLHPSRGPCWVPTAVGSAQVLGLWSLVGPGAVLSPPVLGSAQLPLAQPVVRSAGLGPLPVLGEGLSSELGQCPSAAWWSWGPYPQGSPPLTCPGSCSGLGQVLGGG